MHAITGIDGSYRNHPERLKEMAFDGDALTFYDATTGSGGWVGLELTKPETLAKIRYIFRNDDNNITKGNVYELYFWEEGNWQSLGRQTAESPVLTYDDCPTGALLILRNHTRGKEERIFTCEEGKQVWW
jgi:hypothetical protein